MKTSMKPRNLMQLPERYQLKELTFKEEDMYTTSLETLTIEKLDELHQREDYVGTTKNCFECMTSVGSSTNYS